MAHLWQLLGTVGNMHFFKNVTILFVFCYFFFQQGHAIQENCPKYEKDKPCRDNEIQFFLRTGYDCNSSLLLATIGTYFNKAQLYLNLFYNFRVGENHELIIDKPQTIANANLKQGKPIKFIIHGHTGNKDDFVVTPLQQEYFKLEYNVVVINYFKLSNGTCYRTGVDNSLAISKCAARIIEAIIEGNEQGIKIDDFHIIGVSLGGQMAGQIPNIVDPKFGKFPRITGIDPSNNGFFEDYSTDEYTLTAKDAKLVDVIHTNSGIKGMFPPMGHIDWYPNGGIFQPQCRVGDYVCDHIRSLILFLESIGDENFELEAEWCPNLESKYFNPDQCVKNIKTPFGENITSKKIQQGVHFFNTKDEPPYIRNNNYEVYPPVYKIHLDVEGHFKNKH
ncbi:putative endothelial lipase [Planococcus citri]|uniref:putative endothelial lipase n=1 Tax=Planococcus citri TaxID=170843 RepID=UPI0031F96C90